MDRRDARLAVELAQRWTREGLMPAASLAQIEARHAADARDDPDAESFGSGVLYALAGVLIGAAAFALLFLLMEQRVITDLDQVAPWFLLAWGVLCVAVALALDLAARKPALGDAFHVAALVAVTAAAFPRPHELALGHVAMAFAASVVAYRRRRFLVPFLALAAFNVAWAAVMDGGSWPLRSDDAAFGAWLALVVAQMAFLLWARRRPWPWPTLSLGGMTLLLAGSFLAWHFEVVEEHLRGFEGDFELFLALLMGAMLVLGLRLREKGMVLAAALVVAIDSVVFAFDVGEVIGGLVAILAVAGVLIWQAGTLRRYLREP